MLKLSLKISVHGCQQTKGGKALQAEGLLLLFLPVWLPHSAWSGWLCHLYPVQPSSPRSRQPKSFLSNGSVISAGFDQRTDIGALRLLLLPRPENSWRGLSSLREGSGWACVDMHTFVCMGVRLRAVGCVHLDGRRDVYLQVLPQKIEVDIRRTKGQPRISQTSWKSTRRRGRFTQPQPKQNEAEKGSCIRRGRMPRLCWRATMSQNKNKMYDSYCT